MGVESDEQFFTCMVLAKRHTYTPAATATALLLNKWYDISFSIVQNNVLRVWNGQLDLPAT